MLVEPEIIARAQKGDTDAFNEIVRAYRKRILGTVFRLVGRPDEVEDVAQEVFLRLYFSLEQLREPEVFEPWLYRLTTNAAYDHLRKRKRSMDVRMADMTEEQVSAADALAGGRQDATDREKQEVREMMDTLLGQVSEEDRILLVLKEVQGLSLKELSKVYKVNENALKVRLFRARKRVYRAYEKLRKTNEV